jgi:hypothetical protein
MPAHASEPAGKRVLTKRAGRVAKPSARAASGPLPDPWAPDAPKARPRTPDATESASGALGQDDF